MNIPTNYYVLLSAIASLTGTFCYGAAWVPKKNAYNEFLLQAAAKGDIDRVILALHKGADVNKTDKKGNTPLLLAVRDASNVPVVAHLLAKKAIVDVTNKKGDTALLSIAMAQVADLERAANAQGEYAHKEIVNLLLQAGVIINFAAKKSPPPLFVVACTDLEPFAQHLIEAGADVNFITKDGRSVLFVAACAGHFNMVKRLVEAEADINVALDKAVETGNETAIRILMKFAKISKPAQIQISSDEQSSSLAPDQIESDRYSCSTQDRSDSDDDYNDLLLQAAEADDMNGVIRALKNGADVNTRQKPLLSTADTSLSIAARNGNEKMVRLLLENGADINKGNKYGWTPLIMAIFHYPHTAVDLLVKLKANVNVATEYGRTALMFIADGYKGDFHQKVTIQLIQAKADVNVTDSKGHSALLLNAKKGYINLEGDIQFMKRLIEANADVSAALAKAEDIGDSDAVRFLSEHGGAKTFDFRVPQKQSRCAVS